MNIAGMFILDALIQFSFIILYVKLSWQLEPFFLSTTFLANAFFFILLLIITGSSILFYFVNCAKDRLDHHCHCHRYLY